MTSHQGGCVCGSVRYETTADPSSVAFCHCKFCQRATGSAYMVEPQFALDEIRITKGHPTIYELRSAGSGKLVQIHFCATCGTKLYLTFERAPGACGIYGGTFDDPEWFATGPETAKHIFVQEARHDTIVPAGIPVWSHHPRRLDGTLLPPTTTFDRPHVVGQRRQPDV